MQFEVLVQTDKPDIALVDELARLRLIAKRAGGNVIVRGATSELVELIELAGLTDVISVEMRR